MRSFSITNGSTAGLALAIVLCLAAMPTTAVAADGLRFMVFGDAPYGKEQSHELDNDLAPKIREAEVPFLIHLGDMKGGGEPCTDALIKKRYNQLMNLHPRPVFYTPGDNEWTDCDRPWLKPPVSEKERLVFLRKLILSTPINLPDSWQYATQPEFPENARWTQGDVMFATVHIVGTNNGREEILKDDVETTLDLVDARDQANRAWLRATFDAARAADSGAVVIAIQADVTKHLDRTPCSDTVHTKCDGFAGFRDQLFRLADGFNNKPVLLVHGDTDPFCLDEKFGGDTVPKLWRLNALGDTTSEFDATDITVQLDDTERPCAIKRLTTGAEPKMKCPMNP